MHIGQIIKVAPGRFPRGGFIAALIVGGSVVVDAWARTKFEARKAVEKLAKEVR